MPTISVDDVVVDETNGTAVFTVRLNVADAAPVTVGYSNSALSALNGSDYTPVSGTLTFAPGETVKTISVAILNDAVIEASEHFRLNLSSPSANATIADAFAIGTIVDNDAAPGVSVVAIKDVVVDEADKTATFVITLNKPSTSVVSMTYATQNGTAVAGTDFTAVSGTLTFAPGETAKTIKVTLLNDTAVEASEAFNLVLSGITNATSLDPIGTAIIRENDAAAVATSNISVDDVVVDETQGFADFIVRLDAPNLTPVTVNYNNTSMSAANGSDYTALSGVLTFAPGEMVKTVRMPILNDAAIEATESFRLNLFSPSLNAKIVGDGFAIASIVDNDAAPGTLITNGSFEQNNFFVDRAGFPRMDDVNSSTPTSWVRDSGDLAEYFASSPAFSGVTIYNAADGNFFIGAHDGESWQQTFATTPGTTYLLTYSSAYGAAWWDANSTYYRSGHVPGTVTLVGNSTLLSTNLLGSAAAPTGSTLLDAPFVWTSHSATFTADSNSTTLIFAGSSQNLGGFVFVDNASVTAVPAASLTDAVMDEANQTVTVTVVLDKPSTGNVSFTIAGQDATAIANSDVRVLTALGKITFAPGETAKTITLGLLNDATSESAEVFDVVLSSPVGATIADGRAHIIIPQNDSAPVALPVINVANVATVENKGYVDFVVTLSGPSTNVVTVNFNVNGGTAQNSFDFNSLAGPLVFAPGDVVKTVRIPLIDDVLAEAQETFTLNLVAPTNATIGNASATATIVDNESPAPVAPIAIAGTNGNDVLKGTQFADALTGGNGNDVLDGGAGNDSYDGGAGNDIYLVEETGDTYIEAPGGGTDLVISYLSTHTLGANVENLTLAGSAVTGIGNGGNNTIIGNAGTNTIEGGVGNDILNGGAGTDTVSYSTATAGVTVNLGLTTAQNTVGAGTDTLSNFENLRGSNFNDTLTGSTGNNVIIGGLGNDILNGDAGTDTVSYETATAGVTVSLLLAGAQNTVNAGTDTLSNFENLTGSAFNDTLTGNAGANVLIGGLGNDILNGDAGVDTVSYETATAGVTVSLLLAGAQNTVGAGTDTLSNFENLRGSNLNDTLTGSAGNNTISGGLGNDKMSGNNGQDNFVFNTALNASTNKDSITDFAPVDDTLTLENAIFTQFVATGAIPAGAFVANAGGVSADANDFLLYDTTTGKLFYDADGNGAGAKVEFVTLVGIPALTAADFTII